MFELNLSNALALIDQPVWVVTEVPAATRMVASTQSPVRKARFIPETFRPSAFGAAILAPETASVRQSVLLKSASIPAMTLLTMSSYPLSC